jgi:hypothetical protein
MTKYLIYFCWNTIQTVLVFYKKCCTVVLLIKRTFFTIVFFCKCFGLCTLLSRDLFSPFFYKRTMPYNKKLTDLNRSGSTGKYSTSVLLFWPRYRSVNTASPRLDIFPYCSRSVSFFLFFFKFYFILILEIGKKHNYRKFMKYMKQVWSKGWFWGKFQAKNLC